MRIPSFISAVGLFCGLLFTPVAFGVTITVGPTVAYPGNARPVDITIGTYKVAPILVAPNTPASTKASLIYGALVGLTATPGFPFPAMVVTYTSPSNTVTVTGLPKGTVLKFAPNATGERPDMVTVSLPPGGEPAFGEVGFDNDAFAATDADGNDSVFVAGVTTGEGTLVETVSASSLPDLNGSTIAAALYGLLTPTIASYGAHIVNYTPGDKDLQFIFDTPGEDGVVFGTSALTAGVFGQIADAPEPASVWTMLTGAAALLAGRQRRVWARS